MRGTKNVINFKYDIQLKVLLKSFKCERNGNVILHVQCT
jgi:hypothetical protein